MKIKYPLLYILISLATFCQNTYAQSIQLSHSSKVSLLTNTPWQEVAYALFGHTALRINDPANDLDIVFNYGLFDFDSSNFIYRFAKGETDYSVGYTTTDRYLLGYGMQGIGITEQILNLTTNEKQKIVDALLINCLPENRVYRYNYFYDNCSTRPRDIVEKSIDGTVFYSPTNSVQSYRKLVHECVSPQPWVRFGIDLVIGADADKPITEKQEHFLPKYLMNAFSNAEIKNTDGTSRKLVVSEVSLLKPTDRFYKNTPTNTPFIGGIILLGLSVFISYMSYTKGRTTISKIFDFILFSSAGIAGSVIFFLMYFSVHPCTNPNWNILWLNPLQLIFAFLFLIKVLSKCVYWYHFINFVALILFLLAWFLIPQYSEVAFIPYILALAVRSGVNIIQYNKKTNQSGYSLSGFLSVKR